MPLTNQNIHVLHVLPTLGVGGLELLMSRIIQDLSGHGIQHSIVCLKGEAIIRDRFDDSVPIYCMHARPNELGLPWRVWRLLRRVRPTVIHANNWSAWPDVALARLALPKPPPLIFAFHGLSTAGPMPLRRRLASRILAHITTHIFTVSEASKQMLVKHVGLLENRVDVIPNGIDTDRFHPSKRCSADSDTIIIGTVGSLSPVKNQSFLIRACAKLTKAGISVDLRLAGEGPERSKLTQLAKSLGIIDRVHLFGHVEDVPNFLQQLDIFVLPSDSEAHPVALLEAMSCGIPCIATNVGGVPEALEGGLFGRLVQPGDLAGVVKAIRELINSRDMRKALGASARKRVIEKYGLEQMLKRYAALYGCDRSSPCADIVSRNETYMSNRFTKDNENCRKDSRDGYPTMNSNFITSRTGVSPVREIFSGEKNDRLKSPRVLMLGPTPPLTGGMATVLSNLRESVLARKCQLVVVNNGKTTPESRALIQGIGAQIKILGEILKRIVHYRIEIVHIHTCGGFTFWRDWGHLIVSRLLGCKVVWHIHSGSFNQRIATMSPWQRALLRMALEMGSSVIALSKEMLEGLRHFIPIAHGQIVTNGVMIPKIHKKKPQENTSFLFLGNLSKRKGIDDLIAATAAACRNGFQGTVYLAGGEKTSGDRERVKKLILQYNIRDRIKLLGVISEEQKDKALQEADCFLLPSYSEGLPMALLEAMACELPVIVTDVGDMPKVITDGREGFVIKPGDVKALSERMILLSKDINLRQQMGRPGRLRVAEDYSLDVMAEKIMKVYREHCA